MNVTFPFLFSGQSKEIIRIGAFSAMIAGLLSGCAAQQPAQGINDPNEPFNRKVHSFNVGLDRNLVRPVSKGYAAVLPGPVRQGVSNFADNLEVPTTIVNNVLQGRIGRASENTLRFAVNTVFGLAGFVDIASVLTIPDRKSGFGETLAVWGVGEGAYVERPILGPSTTRDAVGGIVDIFTDPLSTVVKAPDSYYGTGAKVGSKLNDRARFSDTIDGILYDSADGYAQARLLYLQKRRFDLGQTNDTDTPFLDPYEDANGQ